MPGSRRYAFHKGKLFVEENEAVFMLNPWPDPWAKVRGGPSACWRPAVPDFPVVTPFRRPARPASAPMELGLEIETTPSPAEKRRIALARFRSRLPKRIARAIEPVRSIQWQHLVACALSDRFVELIESNPVLAYLWMRTQGRHLDAAQVAAVAETPQRELLRRLRLLDSKAALKFLRKCYPRALSLEMAEGLAEVLRRPDRLARLAHLKQAGTGVIALARDSFLAACAPALLDEVAQCKNELYRAPTAMRLENHLEMSAQLGIALRRPFRSRDDLLRAHRELVRDYQARQRQRPTSESGTFGLPPLVGTQTIQALRTPGDLLREGHEQDNCVASYAGRVHGGTHYIYRVTWPERGTLSIVKGPDGRWRRGELEIAGNRPASVKTCQAIDAWLSAVQRLLRPGH